MSETFHAQLVLVINLAADPDGDENYPGHPGRL